MQAPAEVGSFEACATIEAEAEVVLPFPGYCKSSVAPGETASQWLEIFFCYSGKLQWRFTSFKLIYFGSVAFHDFE